MVGDQQTHIIPAEPEELDRVAKLSGFADTNAFGDALLDRFKRVEAHYGALFEKLPEPPRSAPTHRHPADENDPAALAGLERLGFSNPAAAIAAIRAWQSGRYAATRSERTRERLTEFLPSSARCVRPDRRARSRARHLRQGDGRDAGRRCSCSPCSPPIRACCG